MTQSLKSAIMASICIGVLGGTAWADTQATFDANDEGWLVAGTFPTVHITEIGAVAPPGWDGTEGQPAGSVRIIDVFPWTWIIAPDSWLGDRSASYLGVISFEILIRVSDEVPYPAIALRGANITLYANSPPPPVGSWTLIEVPLTGASWQVNSYTGPVATEAEMMEVLSDLRGIYLLTEWHTGSDDTSVDNVFMSGTPAPACAGDINSDGFTNALDFNILAGNFGSAVVSGTLGDLNNDGVVNAIDFNILAGDFGCGG